MDLLGSAGHSLETLGIVDSRGRGFVFTSSR
jgi:hypothetical protein